VNKPFVQLSFDMEYVHQKEITDMTEKPTGGLDGLYKGSEALATAIVSGAQGIVQKPMTGARVGGFQGFLKGTA
jgi:hypothetical protein